jgi:hypothetical protein
MPDAGPPNYDAIFGSEPGRDPAPPPSGPTDYSGLPWYRKSGVCSGIIVSHLVVGLLGRCVPLIGLLGLLTTAGVIAVCVSALTGPIYYNKTKKDGTLRTWSKWNKLAAVVILVLFIGGYAALMWFLFASGQFGGGGQGG